MQAQYGKIGESRSARWGWALLGLLLLTGWAGEAVGQTVRLSAGAYVVREDGGTVPIQVTISAGPLVQGTVQVVPASGTAIAGANFTGNAVTLTFPTNSVLPQTANLTILDDNIYYPANKTFTVTLQNASPGLNIGFPSTATVTIIEVDPAFSFEFFNFRTNEHAGTATVAIRNIGSTLRGGSVRFRTVTPATALISPVDGSDYATPGVDFTPVNTVIAFAVGVVRLTTPVTISQDTSVEFNEDIMMELNDPGPGNTSLVVTGDPFNPLINLATFTIEPDNFYSSGSPVEAPAGALDVTFMTDSVLNPFPGANSSVGAIQVYPQTAAAALRGKIMVGGDFSAIQLSARNRIARLNANGSVDAAFDPGIGVDGAINCIALQADGRVLIGGAFRSVRGLPRYGIARFNTDGTVDVAFNPGAGATIGAGGPIGAVRAIQVQGIGGAILVGGDFTHMNNSPRAGIVRLTAAGAVDATFDPGTGANSGVYAIGIQSGGQILIGGAFTTVNGTSRNHLAQLNANGSLNLAYDPGFGLDDIVYSLVVQPDDRGVFGGAFKFFNGSTPRSRILRLNTDGSLDPSFAPGSGADAVIYTMALEPVTTNIVIGGLFTSYNQSARTNLARVTPDGTLDPLFMDTAYNANAGLANQFSGPNSAFLSAIAFASTGDILIGGWFTDVGGDSGPNVFGGTTGFGPTFSQDGGAGGLRYGTRYRENIAQIIGVFTNATALSSPGVVVFPTPTYTVNERSTGGFGTTTYVTVRRRDGTLGGFDIDMVPADQTAQSGVDFMPTSSPFTVTDFGLDFFTVLLQDGLGGTVTKTPVLVNADTVVNGNRTLQLILTNFSNVGLFLGATNISTTPVLGFQNSAVLTILDDDFAYGTLTFSSPNFSVPENGNVAVINLVRTNGVTGTVSVQLETLVQVGAGIATALADYVPVTNTVFFAPGQTLASVTVPIIDNTIAGGNKLVNLRLINPAGGAILPGGAASQSAVLTIVDNELTDLAAGSLNPSFNPTNGPNGAVSVVAFIQNAAPAVNGKWMIGGNFTGVDGVTRNRIARLNVDGTVDTATFTSLGNGPDDAVFALAIHTNSAQPTLLGRTVIGGQFTNISGVVRGRIARLNLDGSLDVSFDPGSGADNPVYAVAIQPADGRVIVAGDFTTINGIARSRIARLNLDGSVDATFTPITGANGAVRSVGVDGSGRILLSGDFTTVNGVALNGIARLNPNGSIDTGFNALGTGPNARVRSLLIDPAGKIVIGGDFTTVNGAALNYLARLNGDGSVDPVFNPGTGPNGAVYSVALDPVGSFLFAGGDFTSFGGVGRNRIVRLVYNGTGADGSLDATINFGSGANNAVNSVALQPVANGLIVIGGVFTMVDDVARNYVAQLVGGNNGNGPGTVDFAVSNFTVRENATNATVTVRRFGGLTGTVTVQYTNTAGTALRYPGVGSPLSFDYTNTPAPPLNQLVFPQGEAFATFTIGIIDNLVPGVDRNINLQLLNPGGGVVLNNGYIGTLDTTFNLGGVGANNTVKGVAVQPDGRMIIVGTFTSVNGSNVNRLARLNADGTIDTTFSIGTGADGPVNAVALDTTPGANANTIIIAGAFTTVNGVPRAGVARLSANGAVDTVGFVSFNPGVGGGSVNSLAIQADGAILIAGSFTLVNGVSHSGIARLGADGANDIGFNPVANAAVNSVVIDTTVGANNGKIIIGGDFDLVNSAPAGRIARLLADGSLDAGFLSGAGADAPVQVVAIDTSATANNGKIILGGSFTAFDGVAQVGLARLNADGTADATFNTNLGTGIENGPVNAAVVDAAGNVVVAGAFDTVNSLVPNRAGLARLNGDGTLDQVFLSGTGPDFPVQTVALLPDGKLVLGGDFTAFSGTVAGHVARIQTGVTLTILDDDSVLGFAAANFSVNENVVGGNAVVTVSRLGGTAGTVTVNFATSNLTATSSLDYSAVSGLLTFSNGQSSATFLVPILSDALVEGNESVLLSLFNPQPSGNIGLGLASATLTIVDADFLPGTLNFAVATYSVDEAGTNAVVMVTRTNGTTGVITVNFSTSDGSARAGLDYVGTSGILSFADGETNKSIVIPIILDTISEASETFDVSLAGPTSGGALLGSQTSTRVTIINNDIATFGNLVFSAPTISILDGSGNVTLTINRIGGTQSNLTVDVISAPVTAIPGADYLNVITNVLFTNGQISATVNVPILRNLAIQGDTTFSVYLTNLLGGASLANPNVVTVTINEADFGPGIIGFTSASFLVGENQTNAVITVSRTNGFTGSVTVDYATIDQTAVSNVDYFLSQGQLTFLNGETNKTFLVRIQDDTVYQGNRTFDVRLMNAVGASLGLTNAPVTILDNESPAGQVDTTFNANIGSAANGVIHSLALSVNGLIVAGGDFNRFNGSPRTNVFRLGADGLLDISFVPPVITYRGGAASVRAVAIYQSGNNLGKVIIGGQFDRVQGQSRTNIARLNNDGSLDLTFDPGLGADNVVLTVALQSNGQPVIGGAFTMVDGNSLNFVARLNVDGSVDGTFAPGAGPNAAVRSLAIDGSRIVLGGDFTLIDAVSRNHIAGLNADGTVDKNFDPGLGANDSVNVVAVDASSQVIVGGLFTSIGGANFSRVARLNPNGSIDGGFLPAPGADEHVSALGLQTADGMVLIGGGFQNVDGIGQGRVSRLTINGRLDTSFNVGSGANDFLTSLIVQPDGKVLLAGAFTVVNGLTNNYIARLNGGTNVGAGSFEFLSPNFFVAENGGSATITVTRLGGATGPASVDYTTADGTALANKDYLGAAGTLNFGPGVNFQTFTVSVFDNNINDGTRTNSLILFNPTGGATLGVQSVAALNFLDNDSILGFSSPAFSVTENGRVATITAKRVGGVVGAVGISYATSNGTAIVGTDYTNSVGLLTWADGDGADKSFQVGITDNLVTNANKTVLLSLFNVTGNAIALQTNGTLTIVDNEFGPGVVSFASAAFTVNEAVSNALATITVIRTNGSRGSVSAAFGAADGTATNGVHYLGTNGTFFWADGDASPKTFTVGILDDFVPNPNRTVLLTLSTNTGGLLLGLTNATLTIQDNDSVFSFSATNYTVGETGLTVAVTVLRQGALLDVASVELLTQDLTATGGVHYAALATVLDFAPGQAFSNVLVTVIDDAVVNDDRLVSLVLSNAVSVPTGSASLGLSNATVTIVNNDIDLQFSAGVYTVAETNGFVTIFVVRTGVTNVTNTVAFATTNGTALDGLDYRGTNGVLTFVPGDTNLTFDVLVFDNTVTNVTRTVLLSLSNPTGPLGTQLGALSNAVVNLTDDEIISPPAGGVDGTFVSLPGANAAVLAVSLYTNAALPALLGKMIIAGDFTQYDGTNRGRIARLNADGSLDNNFLRLVGGVTNGSIVGVVVQPDGRVLAAGFFTNVNGVARNHLVRLDVNGLVDATFTIGTGANAKINALALQPDGKVLIVGDFTLFNGAAAPLVARLNTNGTLDATFNVGVGPNNRVQSLALQPDGKVLIGGDFTAVNGLVRNGLARLTTTGSVDVAFDPGVGFDGTVNALAVRPDGKVFAGGEFRNVAGQPRSHVAMLSALGIVEVNFNTAVGADDSVFGLALQADGQLLVGGSFTTYGGVVENRIARVNSDGSLDLGITFGSGANNFISAIAVQPWDAKIIAVGGFSQFDGINRSGVVRLNGGSLGAGAGALQFASAAFTVAENSGSALVTVVRLGGATGVVSVDYATADSPTALAGINYSNTFGTLTFEAGETIQTFAVPLIDDAVTNAARTVNLVLSNPAGATIGALGASVLTVQDNDSVFSFSVAAYPVGEGAGSALITVVRSGGLLGTSTVDFATVGGGTAAVGVDYVGLTNTLVFGPGVATQTVAVVINDDLTVEGNETVNLALLNPTGAAALASPATAVLTIIDDDFGPGQLGFASATFAVNEGATNAVISVIRTNGSSGTVSVGFRTVAGTATAPADYATTNGSLTFGPGVTSKSFSVRVVDDAITEGDEAFAVQLFNFSGGATAGITNAVVTLIDNDGVVQFSAPAYTVSETATNALITVTRLGATNNAVTVNFFAVAGSATVGQDFLATNGVLTFAIGVTTQTFAVAILDDSAVETPETVLLSLSGLTGVGFIGSQSNAVLTMVDNDVSLEFASANYVVQESGPNAIISVLRTGDTNGTVSVNYGTSDGTATAGADYVAQTGTLVFGPGETNKSFSVTILQDTLVEGNETVNLALSLPGGNTLATLGARATATLTITDDDTAIEFTAATYSFSEAAGVAAITIRRTGILTTAVSATLTTSNGTATAGLDYTAVNTVVNFGPGVVLQTVNVPISVDASPEGDETVFLFLTTPTGGAVLGANTTAVLTILDNDVSLQLSAAVYSVSENAGTVTVPVSRTGATNGSVGVTVATANGSAISGQDYTAVNLNLTFLPGVTNLTVAIPISEDLVAETNETFTVTLSAPTGGAVLGVPSVATVRIVDNDRVGSVDADFATGVGANGSVAAVAVQGDGRVVIAGNFTAVNGTNINRLARLGTNGALDLSFNVGLGLDNIGYALAVQADGSVLVGGSFTRVNGTSQPYLARLTNGTLDAAFAPVLNGPVVSIVVLASGQMLIGGDFTNVQGQSRNRIARLNADGSLDAWAAAGGGADGIVYALGLQSDGKVLVGGLFNNFHGFARTRLARLNAADGSLDVPYNPDTGAGSQIYAVAVQADDRVIIGGSFSRVNSSSRTNLTRLNVDGTVDFAYTSGSGPNSTVRALSLDAAGRLSVGGDFTSFNGVLRSRLARLNPNGALDATFDVGVGADAAVLSVVAEVDGHVVVGGDFTSMDGLTVGHVARMNGDHGVVQLAVGAVSVLESSGSVTLSVVRLAGSSGQGTLGFTTVNGTALAGSDFTGTNGTLVFNPGVTNLSVTIAITGDKAVEAAEDFQLVLTNAVSLIMGAQTNTLITILDDDSSLQFTFGVTNVLEDVGNVVFTVVRTGDLNGTVSVPFTTVNGTATALQDYVPVAGTLVFGTNVASQTITVPILNDQVEEPNKAFSVALGAPVGEASLGAFATAVVNIIDNDSTFTLQLISTNLLESVGSVSLVVDRTGYLTNAVLVNFVLVNGSAVAVSDFTVAGTALVFGPGAASRQITVQIVDDPFAENDEGFTVALGAVTGEGSLGGNTSTAITIEDDDVNFSLSQPSTTTGESQGGATITILRSGATNYAAAVLFTTSDGTALSANSTDYTGLSNLVFFAAGQLSATVFVPVRNDTIAEGDETVNLTLSAGLTAAGGTVSYGTPNGLLIIQDNDVTFGFSQSTYAVREEAGFMAVPVVRFGDTNSAVSVRFATTDGTATAAGLDYTPTNGVVNFAPGEVTKTFNVVINDDALVEGDETLNLTLSNPVNGVGATALGQATATLTLIDNDVQFTFATANFFVGESGTNGIVVINRSGDTNAVVSVDFATADGSAMAGLDYVGRTNTVVFGVGQVSAALLIPILNDVVAEQQNETVNLQLFNATNLTGSAIYGVSNAVLIIVEDDFLTPVADTVAPVTLVAENFVPANNAADPFERVTVNLALRNIGNVNSVNITATLLATNGIIAPSGEQSYGVLVAGGAAVARPFSFTVGTNAVVTANLQLFDGPVNLGVVAFNIPVGVGYSFTNRTIINLPGAITVPSAGPADPYPAMIQVTNVTGVLRKVTVRLNQLTHTWPADIDIMLVSPAGQKVILMSDAGAGFPVSGLNLTFDDAATASLPDQTPIVSGNYKPTDYPPADVFTNAPAGPVQFTMSAFEGFDPNGTWSLYVVDDTALNNGAILSGWTLNLTTVTPAFDLAIAARSSPEPVAVGGALTYVALVTNLGPSTVNGVVVTNPLPAGSTFLSAGSSRGTHFDDGAGNIVFSLGALTNGGTASVTVVVSLAQAGFVTNTVRVSGIGGEIFPANDTATVVSGVGVNQGLVLGLVGSPNPVAAGSTLTYTISVTNRAGTAGTGVMVTNVLPPNVNFVSASASVGSVNQAGGVVVANLGALAAGTTATVTIQVVPQSAGSHTNTATATAVEPALNGPSGTATVITTVNGFTLLSLPSAGTVRTTGYSLTIIGQVGHTYVLQLSTNLTVWVPVSTNSPVGNGPLTFSDPTATNSPRGFYRVVEP